MNRLAWLAIAVALTVVVAVQVTQSAQRSSRFVAEADIPTLAAGTDVLGGIPEIPVRLHGNDYRRAAFGEAWDDDNSAPGGYNGCDTRNDILNRDLTDKTYVAIKRCPTAVATGTLHDPYTNAVVAFVRGNQVGASVQIDDIGSVILTNGAGVCNGQRVDYMPLTVADVMPVRAVV